MHAPSQLTDPIESGSLLGYEDPHHEVVLLVQAPHATEDLRQWLASGLLNRIAGLLVLEFGLAVFSDVLGRAVSLLDSLLSERFSNETSLRLMEHAALLGGRCG